MRLLALLLSVVLPAPAAVAVLIGITPSGSTVIVNPFSGESHVVGDVGFSTLHGIAVDSTGRILTSSWRGGMPPRYIMIDPVSGSGLAIAIPWVSHVRAIEFIDDETMYVLGDVGFDKELFVRDLTEPTSDGVTFIGEVTITKVLDLALRDGVLYGWSSYAGLVTIDPLTAVATNVNGLLDGHNDILGITFGPDGTLYGVRDRLFVIDPVSGVVTEIGGNVPGLYNVAWLDAECVADASGPLDVPDGHVDAIDFLVIIGDWGAVCDPACQGDVTGPGFGPPDGIVDAFDFLKVIAEWGTPAYCPDP